MGVHNLAVDWMIKSSVITACYNNQLTVSEVNRRIFLA